MEDGIMTKRPDAITIAEIVEQKRKDIETNEMKGYLKKKSSKQKWQKRWFETNSHYLTYFKNKDSGKILACIDLQKVGGITLNTSDPSNTEFTVTINGSYYYLKADTKEEAIRWVDALNIRHKTEKNKLNINNLNTLSNANQMDELEELQNTSESTNKLKMEKEITPEEDKSQGYSPPEPVIALKKEKTILETKENIIPQPTTIHSLDVKTQPVKNEVMIKTKDIEPPLQKALLSDKLADSILLPRLQNPLSSTKNNQEGINYPMLKENDSESEKESYLDKMRQKIEKNDERNEEDENDLSNDQGISGCCGGACNVM